MIDHQRTQKEKVFNFLYENQNKSFTPYYVSIITLIPNASVRRIMKELKSEKRIIQNEKPITPGNSEYYTNDLIIENYVVALKKQKRNLQMYLVTKKRRSQ